VAKLARSSDTSGVFALSAVGCQISSTTVELFDHVSCLDGSVRRSRGSSVPGLLTPTGPKMQFDDNHAAFSNRLIPEVVSPIAVEGRDTAVGLSILSGR